MTTFDAAGEAADRIRGEAPGPYDAAIVLGSGLDPLAERISSPVVIPYGAIPHFPPTTVAGHAGQLVVGELGGRRVIVLRGRYHSYEGHDLDVVTFPIRVLARLQVPRVVLTAATGGIRADLGPGSILALSDHLNLIGGSPLRGPNDDRLGTRFPDMTEVYSSRLRRIASEAAQPLDIPLTEGVYACVPGPQYETPAEVRMLRALGADVVGMSTVPEAMAARHSGLEVLGLAIVANRAAGLGSTLLSHAEVLETVRGVAIRLADLLESAVARL